MHNWQLPSLLRQSCLARSPVPPWCDLSTYISVEFPVRAKASFPGLVQHEFSSILHSEYYNRIHLYTDGSKSLNRAASAYVIPSLGVKYCISLDKCASVITTELLAILKAMEYCVSQNTNDNYVIFTDSMSSLQLLMNPKSSSYRNLSYQILELIFSQKGKIMLRWVPSHMGIQGNESADTAAKSDIDCPVPYNKIPKEDYNSLLTRKQNVIFQQSWREDIQQKQKALAYYDIKNTVNIWPWTYIPDRKLETALGRLRTHHVGLGQHLFRFEMADSPLCSCGEIESVSHYLLSCPNHTVQRRRMAQTLCDLGVNCPFDVKLLLGGRDLSAKIQREIGYAMKTYLCDTNKINYL